jgi:hypothetical protein
MSTRTRHCIDCNGQHPETGERPTANPVITVDGVAHQLTLYRPFGAHWTFPHPHGGRGTAILMGNPHTVERLTCAVRRELAGPPASAGRTPATAWQHMSGRGIGGDADNDAGRLRHARVLAAYRLAYGVATDMDARAARERDETECAARYARTADRWGDNARAARYLAAYAAVLAGADPSEPVYPVERLCDPYAAPVDQVAAPAAFVSGW